MNYDLFLCLLLLGALTSFAYPFVASRKQLAKRTQSMQVMYFLLGTSLLAGLLTNSFHSHGFDIPWWVFGLFYGLTCAICLGLGTVILKFKNNSF